MQAYSSVFAGVYNALWSDFANRVGPPIRQFYEMTPTGQCEKSLLDLCCGTGQLALHFLDQGYRVVGLDLSEGMLKFARQSCLSHIVAGQAQFVQADAAHFELAEQFGLVVSTFDALNHLPDEAALRGCFQSVFAVLKTGGYFIFDLNTQTGLRRWNGGQVLDRSDEVFLYQHSIFDDFTIKAWTRITGFVLGEDGRYTRFDETVYNTVFEMAAVRDWLAAAGFRTVYCACGDDLSTAIEQPEEEARAWFVAHKDDK